MKAKFLAIFCVCAAALGASSGQASAATIYYNHIFSGTAASGSIGGVNFTNANFTITGTVDPANQVHVVFEDYYINHSVTWIEIEGIGEFEITTALRTFIAGDFVDIVGLSRAGEEGTDLLDSQRNLAFSDWQLVSPLGPVSFNGILTQWNNPPVETSGGVLILNGPLTNASFTSVAIPEPSSSLLALSCGVSLLSRRRGR